MPAHARHHLRDRAVALRREGRSYREIGQVVGVAKSTLSEWLRDVPLTEEQQHVLALRSSEGASRRAQAIRANAVRRRSVLRSEAEGDIGDLGERDLFVAGVVAYWAEGTKDKPWRGGQSVRFMNSDPGLVRLFLAWLRLLGISVDQLVFHLHIHTSADLAAALTFWSGVVGVPASRFGSCTLKVHNPMTVRKNVGGDYHGCLLVHVRNSAALNVRTRGGAPASLERPSMRRRVASV